MDIFGESDLVIFLIFIIITSIGIFIRRKHKIRGEQVLNHFKDFTNEKYNVEIDYSIIDRLNQNAFPVINTGEGTIQLFDSFIYVEQNSLLPFANMEILNFPLILCANDQILKAKFHKNNIAKIRDYHLTPWNSLKIKAEIIKNGTSDIELNILFLQNKDENVYKLKNAIEEMEKQSKY